VRVGQRRAARERFERRLGRDEHRGWLKQPRLACCTGCIFGRGAGRTAVWITATTGATGATGTTNAGSPRGGCWIAGCIHRGYDLRAQPGTASRHDVRARSVWLYGGAAAEQGRAVETGRMSQVVARYSDLALSLPSG
jgi:hypothetical protein